MTDNAVFGYQDPPGDKQCGSCFMWSSDNRCMIHGKRQVTASMSCVYYVFGKNRPADTTAVTNLDPSETGLIDRQVRCENCKWFEDPACNFFIRMNKTGLFQLETRVSAKGCCNAQEPPEQSKKSKEEPITNLLGLVAAVMRD
jgi:hypothetical protein